MSVSSVTCASCLSVPTFQEAGIDGSMLVDLSDEDLEELGVANKFHRRKIMKKIGLAKAAK